MKARILTCITAITLLAALVVPVRQTAQQEQLQYNHLPHYIVTDLGTLGGRFSYAGGLNDSGWVEGASTLPGDAAVHAFLWGNGVMTDLGALGGPNSSAYWPPAESGEAAGGAEISTPDPLGEDFCGFGTHLVCLPFLWRNGAMTPLPTLGGNNGYAQEINDWTRVVGLAENTTLEPSCAPRQVLQFKPVIWDTGEVHELPTFPGDPVGAANAINDIGQAAGFSGNCTTAFHALLWRNGTATDLGNLGGIMNNFGVDINNQGQVVGGSDLSGDTTYHAFLWQNGVMTDLGTLPGDYASGAEGINSQGQVVGCSADESEDSYAFLWQDGVMTDLNTLIPAGSPLFLLCASGGINSYGQIAGLALEMSTGEVHAFLATPSLTETTSEGATPAARRATREGPKIVLPESVRKLLQQPLGFGRFRLWPAKHWKANP
jgi:probable HAF family extracellular repeat protein